MTKLASCAVALVVVFSTFLAAAAAAAPAAEPGTYPVSQLPILAQQYAPGLAIPTKLPAAMAQFRLGTGRLDGYAQRASVEVRFEKDSVSLLGFRLDVFPGSRVAPVTSSVATYLKKGGGR